MKQELEQLLVPLPPPRPQVLAWVRNSRLAVSLALLCWGAIPTAFAQTNQAASASGTSTNPIARIRDEGMNRSEVMKTLSYLCDVIGQRLTGSPNLKRANEWTRDQLTSYGLCNAHLEAWGPFGRGWTLKRFSAQVISPQAIPLIAYPAAWSPGLEGPITAEVVYLDARTDADLEKYKGKLKGAIVLASPVRQVRTHTEPLANRLTESELLRLANAAPPRVTPLLAPPAAVAGRRGGAPVPAPTPTAARGTNVAAGAAAPGARGGPATGRGGGPGRFSFYLEEGVAAVVSPSSMGDLGTVFVAQAAVPPTVGRAGGGARPAVYATNAPPTVPQFTLAVEDYNRIVRMVQQGEKVKMSVEFQVQFSDDDPMAYNTIAEIPGTDLKDEVVMLGGHLDSWQAGTGATDNAAGVAACMEAVRIMEVLKLQPRRTIRVGLWSGEEQGIFGSKAYVVDHFGYLTNGLAATALRSPGDSAGNASASRGATANSARRLIRRSEYDKLSAYFNLDNGGGKIRGVYLQGNEAVRPIFRRWMEPFRDMGADTLTPSNTGGTDHLSFDGIGLPGFQFIQDPLDYESRTHHSNADVYDRIQPDDLKQATVILAGFVYDAAMADEMLPRKPLQ